MSDASVRRAGRLSGLRANALAALVMLVLEFGLGVAVNLYATLPRADHGQQLFVAFGSAVTRGPIILTLHALLGTFLLITAVAALVRAVGARRVAHITLTAVALVVIVAAWLSGASFVGDGGAGSSMGMAVATGVAFLCYVLVLFIAPASPSA